MKSALKLQVVRKVEDSTTFNIACTGVSNQKYAELLLVDNRYQLIIGHSSYLLDEKKEATQGDGNHRK